MGWQAFASTMSAIGPSSKILQYNANKKSYDLARDQYNYQQNFDANALSIRAADARRAGFHPLAALGFNGNSSVSGGVQFSPDMSAFTRTGTDMLNALDSWENRKLQKQQRQMNELQIENQKLQNQALKAEISGQALNSARQASSSALNSAASMLIPKQNPMGQRPELHSENFSNVQGVDKHLQETFSYGHSVDPNRIEIRPGKDLQVDDFGSAFLNAPDYIIAKFLPMSEDAQKLADYATDIAHKQGTLKDDERFILDWENGRNVLRRHKINRKSLLFKAFKKFYERR